MSLEALYKLHAAQLSGLPVSLCVASQHVCLRLLGSRINGAMAIDMVMEDVQ